jgi:hypothetical protein
MILNQAIVVTVRMGILSFLLVGCAFAQEAKPGCQCRAPDGSMKDIGAVQCFDIVGTQKLVRCEMSTTPPFWKKVDGVVGCPIA